MERKFTLICCFIFLLGIFSVSRVHAQVATPIVQDKVIKVNLRQPPKRTDRYIENNARKKKLKTKIRMMHGWECPSYLHYESKPQKKREKATDKRRKKI